MNAHSDPTAEIRLNASQFEYVDEGQSCSQTSFKTGGKAFLYIGEQGGRYKAMFKLKASLQEASRLAQQHPEDYQIGAKPWVTARFSADEPMPKSRWLKWLKESYDLSR